MRVSHGFSEVFTRFECGTFGEMVCPFEGWPTLATLSERKLLATPNVSKTPHIETLFGERSAYVLIEEHHFWIPLAT